MRHRVAPRARNESILLYLARVLTAPAKQQSPHCREQHVWRDNSISGTLLHGAIRKLADLPDHPLMRTIILHRPQSCIGHASGRGLMRTTPREPPAATR